MKRDLVVIGASAGGLQALTEVVKALPESLPAAVLLVVHTSPSSRSGGIAGIMDRSGPLPASTAKDGEEIKPGRIYVAQPNHHLTVSDGRVCVQKGPQENGFRPAVDPLFRTAAQSFGPRVIGVILSGGLSDGTHGLSAIKRAGGIAIAQSPEEALVPGMPMSAVRNVAVDFILPIERVGPEIARLVDEEVDQPVRRGRGGEPPIVSDDPWERTKSLAKFEDQGRPPSVFTCPTCHGAMWELEDGGVLRYRCHVGHEFAAENLFAEQSEEFENALWMALRTLEEKAALARRMAERALQAQMIALARTYDNRAQEATRQSDVIRRVLLQEEPDATRPVPERPRARRKESKARRKRNARQNLL